MNANTPLWSGLVSIASTLAKAFFGNPAEEPFWHDVKLIHADDLQAWGAFKEYSEHQSITYADYWAGVKRIDALKSRVVEITRTQEKLAQLETGDFEKYDPLTIHVPRSLFRKELEIPLPEPPHAETKMTCFGGEIKAGKLYIRGKWKEQSVLVSRSCPSRILHQDEIASLQQRLKEFPPADLDIVDEIKTSRFSQPVLFISHRWEGVSHPDPERHQYQKLSVLKNCFMIYDYSSFPQRITDQGDKDALQRVLTNMNRLIKNVVILQSPSYIERGWCIYEYTLASLALSTVCDEISAPDFVTLRNLAATQPTSAGNLKGHSVDSAIQNSIALETIKTVNQILPRFSQAQFTVEADRKIVTDLLLDRLVAVLPPKREYPSPYLGEWVSVSWTREELQNAFQQPIPVSKELHSPFRLKPYQLKVPDALEAAVANHYALDKAPPNMPWTFLERINLEVSAEAKQAWRSIVPILQVFFWIVSFLEWVRNAILWLPRQIARAAHRVRSRLKR